MCFKYVLQCLKNDHFLFRDILTKSNTVKISLRNVFWAYANVVMLCWKYSCYMIPKNYPFYDRDSWKKEKYLMHQCSKEQT